MVKITKKNYKEIKSLNNEINDLKRNLLKIKLQGTAHINLVKYEKKLGLVKIRRYKTKDGYLKDLKMSLTPKGERILKGAQHINI